MFANIGTTEIIIIAVVLIVLFGAKFLPKMGKSLGESKVEMKKATSDLKSALKDEE
ncbi:MAG: twin-arginine translocase TatA/TatE family subunit [Microgenomates group bacterium]